jgi:hypothetical protein
VIVACALDGADEGLTISEIELREELAQLTIVVGCCSATLEALRVHQCIYVHEARAAVAELNGGLYPILVDEDYFIALPV